MTNQKRVKMKNDDLVYAVEIYMLIGGGVMSATIDTLYFKNKKDAEKVINYWEGMNIPHTYGLKNVEYGDIPRKYNIIESVSGENKGEILYNLSPEFKERVDDYYKRHPRKVLHYGKTWDELCNDTENDNKYTIKAKDNARAQLRAFIMGKENYDIDGEESPEDEIERFLDEWVMYFDEKGNLITWYRVKE